MLPMSLSLHVLQYPHDNSQYCILTSTRSAMQQAGLSLLCFPSQNQADLTMNHIYHHR